MSGRVVTFRVGVTQAGAPSIQSYTAQDMVQLALKAAGILGVGQTALTQDLNDVFSLLQGMLGQWNRRRWLIWHLLDIGNLCDGSQSYTVGPGGNFDIPRPDRIEGGYIRQIVTGAPNNGQNVDYWLTLLEAMEDYAKVPLKTLTSWPQAIFYDSAFPVGRVFPIPIPSSGNPTLELHIIIKDTLQRLPSLTTPVNLPDEYFEALWSNLAIRVAGFYPGSSITDETKAIAKASLQTIRTANAQVPRLLMPTSITRPPLFNIYSYQTY